MSWELTYVERRKNLEDALRAVKRGAKVFLGTACAEPQHLVEGLIDRAGRLHDVQVLHFITLGDAPCTEKRFDTRGRVSVPGQCAHAENLREKRGLQRRYPGGRNSQSRENLWCPVLGLRGFDFSFDKRKGKYYIYLPVGKGGNEAGFSAVRRHFKSGGRRP